MSLRDVDVQVRVRALQAITLIDATGFLEDEEIAERDQVARLLFDSEQRVRKAVSGFVANLWKERSERMQSEVHGAVGNKKKRVADAGGQDKVDEYIGYKAMISLVVETSNSLEGDEAGTAGSAGSALVASATPTEGAMTRAMAVVQSLDVPPLQDWTELAEYLLLDHSGSDEDAWLLDEEEQEFGLQIMCACVGLDLVS